MSDHALNQPLLKRGEGLKILRNKKFQDFLLGVDKQLQKNRKQQDPPQSQDEDVLMAHDRMLLGKNYSGKSNILNSTAKSFISGSTAAGRSKDDIFDDFLSDLFTTKLNISNNSMQQKSFAKGSAANNNNTLPLD